MGEEPYYIDKLANAFTKNVLSAEEQEFNQVILYGKEIETAQAISEAKQFPFGSDKRVVIIKEAQHLKDIDKLDTYLDNVQPSTILVICYKGKSVDKRKKFGKTLSKKCVVFESKKLYDNKIPAWINSYVIEKGYKIDNNATAVLSEYIGSDLSKITNELEKVFSKMVDKNPEKALVLMKQLGTIVGWGVTKTNQAKGKSFRYELKKK